MFALRIISFYSLGVSYFEINTFHQSPLTALACCLFHNCLSTNDNLRNRGIPMVSTGLLCGSSDKATAYFLNGHMRSFRVGLASFSSSFSFNRGCSCFKKFNI